MKHLTTLLILFSIIALNPVWADDTTDSKTKDFDGSEFKRKEFATTDFDRHDYSEEHKAGESDSKFSKDDDDDHKSDDDRMGLGEDVKKEVVKKATEKQERNKEILFKPVHEDADDWLPSGIDITNNGGFTTSPDNGSPLPYRLNGHIDIP